MTNQTIIDKLERAEGPLNAGFQRWHSSEEDGGPDVGIEIGMPDGSVLWVGEISKSLYETSGMGCGDGGWWVVHWKVNGNPNVIGPASPSWLDFGGVDAFAAALRARSQGGE